MGPGRLLSRILSTLPFGIEAPVRAFNVWILSRDCRWPWRSDRRTALPLFGARDRGARHGYRAIDAFHNRKRSASPSGAPSSKRLSSTITIGCGGSAGREGPIAMIGAALGFTHRKIAGAERSGAPHAAGRGHRGGGRGHVSSSARLAALFAAEVLYRERWIWSSRSSCPR